MAEFLLPFIIFTLIIVIIIQAVERYFFARQSTSEVSRLITALLSKDATEYSQALKTEKQPVQPTTEPDEVNLADATDEVFDKFIKAQTQ